MRRAARAPHARAGLRGLLAIDPSDYATSMRSMRRSTAGVEIDQRRARAVSAVPARAADRRSRAGHRRVRRGAPRRHSRVEVRGTAIAGAAARGADARARRRDARRRRLRRARAAASIAPARARLQSGSGSGAAARGAGGARASPPASDGHADRFARRQTSPQRPRRLRRDAPCAGNRRIGHRPGRRREHDGRDARRVRARPERCGRTRSSGPYGSASRDRTTVKTSSAMSSFDCSPSTTTQRPPAA